MCEIKLSVPGEALLALESSGAVVILDGAVARRLALRLKLKVTGTLGVLLDAKRAGLIAAGNPLIDSLQQLRFRRSEG